MICLLHPPGSSFLQQHVVVADVCPGCVVMAVTPSRSLHVVTTFSSNASSASPDCNSAIIPTQVEGLITRMRAGGHSHETLCDRNQEVKPVTGDFDSLTATAAAASSAVALPVLDSRVLAPSSGSGAASSNPMTSRKRARQGTHLSTGCVIPLKQEVSCLQVKPLPSAAAGHYLVLLGHYGTYNGSVDDDDSGMNSSHPGSTLMMLAPTGPHNSAAVASDPMPSMDWGVISEGLPPDVLSQLGPPWGAAGSTMMMVPESVLLLEPKPLRAPVPSLHHSGPLASIESVNWLVGYRQGLLALYQYRPRAAPGPPQLYSTNAIGMATLSTERSGDPASAQLLWCMQLGDLPLSLSPLPSPPPYRDDLSQGKDDLDMETRSGSDTTAVALSVGRSMSVISISPLNNRLHAQTVALQGVASASCLDIAMQALGSKKLPVRACPGAGAGVGASAGTTSIQQAPAPVTTTPPLDLSHNSGGLCHRHHAVVIHHSGTWSVEALGQGLNFAGSARSSSGSSSTASNRFSCHPPHTVPIQQLALGSLFPERLLPHPPSQSLLMLSTAPLSRAQSSLGQCQKDDKAGCAGAHQIQVLGRPRPGRGMLDMRLGETRHEGLSDGRLVEPSTGKDCDRGATAAVGSRINVLDPLTGASLARYHCLEAETATCMETWRTTYQITLGSHFRSSSLTATCNDSHLTTSLNQQPRDQQPLFGAPGGLQSHAITLSNRTTASSMGGEAPDNTACILGGGATSRPGTGSRHATGGGSTKGPAAAAAAAAAAVPPSNDDAVMTQPDADHGLEAHDPTERKQEWKISQDWMIGQLLGEFLSPRVQRAFINRPLSNLQDDLIILATSRNCLSSTEGEGGGASTSNKVQSRITVLRLVRLPGRTSNMNSQILSTVGHLRTSVSMRDDTKQHIEAEVGSGQASISHLEGSSQQSFPSNQSKAAHQRAVLPHHQPTALSNKGRSLQKKMDSYNKDGDSGPWVLQVMARTEVAYNPVSAVCGIHGTDVLLCTAGRRLVVYRLKSKLSVQACVEEGVEKMRGSAVEIIQATRQEDAAAAPSGSLSAEGRAREQLGEGHSSAGASSHRSDAAAAAASVHDSDRRSPHLDGPSSTAFLLPADAAAHSRGDLPPAAAAATRPAARSHNLERTAWAHMISPARQLSVQPGGLHISVLHECGRVTIWELTRSLDVEALQVLAANSLTRNITSIHMLPKQMSCSYPYSTCLHEDSSIPLGSAMGLTSRSDVPSSHLTSYSHGRSVDAVDSRPRVRNPPDAVDAPAAQICSSTAPNARRREALPSVLTLDDGGCFAALSLPDKTLCPQRNLEASYLFNTDASHARMTMVSSSTTREAQYADSALSLEGGAAAAWAGWLKNLAKSAADPSFSNERVSSLISLISLAKIESAANGCLVPPLFDSGSSSSSSSSAMFISDAAGQVCCLSRVHPQAAWVLLRLQAALMGACPSARPLSGVDFAEHRYTFRRHQVRLPFQQSCRRVVDSEVLSLFLDLPRHQRLKVVSCFWRSAVRELSSGGLEDVPNHTTLSTNTCKSSEPYLVKEDDLDLMEGSSSLQLRAGLCDLEFLERRVGIIVDLIVQEVLMGGV
ncbi:hypothetical protein CEUSTIGMA_g10423.t1 [Chlamydomonas eustigma]|uniref:Uncharacterized protein n=1 Tax=Chlamydomonas eustigma TaxID=1157962 RepID=A0A250XJ01_9CHLO|nr:hypothetical protein CEUSTIGMA_g10423.t1 [Chlamydomonas eustigma]|eukprot:GAX82996.1 hypothetical protein CEUSTIGMA_g10423.t1 [Chlamydomonas eustigma]